MFDDAMVPAPAHVSGLPVWQRLGLGVLTEHVPVGLIDEVLVTTGRVQQRIRRLPARVTVLFILGLALFSGVGYRGVWRELLHSGGVAAGPVPSSNALTQARRRVGVQPLRELFCRLRGPRAVDGAPGAFLAGCGWCPGTAPSSMSRPAMPTMRCSSRRGAAKGWRRSGRSG